MNLDLPTPNIEVDLLTTNHDVTANHDAMTAPYQVCFDLRGAL
ncbi:MAG: hypothetical protein ACPGVG_07070 [Mycobacterium sp.]